MAGTTPTLEAARHLCQEARVVLTSLRGGPPNVARGDLAQDLMDVRALVNRLLLNSTSETSATVATTIDTTNDASGSTMTTTAQNEQQAATGDEEDGDAVLVQSPGRISASLLPTNEDVGPCARPFLAVVMDPRAAGPHTLVALRSLHRLLEKGSLVPNAKHCYKVGLEPLTKGVLNCKFEQTDAGADEAVEMAIADLLALMVQIDRRAIRNETLMDAFNTVFVTRNTFVHSPALCYHFEDVLTTMLQVVFEDLDTLCDPAGKLILELLVNQLLHTPFVGGDDEASREAQMAHDATRVLCLRLTRTALRTGFSTMESDKLVAALAKFDESGTDNDRSLLHIIQDDLCLALLMTGQAIWAFEGNNNISPGFISLEVLSEICSTLSTLWTSVNLRKYLVVQFESIFTGFFQRALVLLRQRQIPIDSISFHANIIFDASTEIILECLVDIMTLHDHSQTVAQGNGGSLESLFATYDCNMRRSDAAAGLMIELCRCCGSKVDEEGEIIYTPLSDEAGSVPDDTTMAAPPAVDAPGASESGDGMATTPGLRQIPPHLKELCAEVIIGGMKCMFNDDHPTEETKLERRARQSIFEGQPKVMPSPQSISDLSRAQSVHLLRSIKSKKRLMRKAAHLFNKKASKGIEFLANSGVIPDPVTPRSVASFLRNGIVVGLDKKAVGAYLGEMGKSPVAGKSPPNWERDFFHKEVLETYCSLFRFENQSLLDGLRMFLACFRLPGEAQQIDRILQAFSDSCSRLCEEGGKQLFSEDPKRASDAAYLLSFSIIMLNTDQHNDNIREDRKMTKNDFIKNNADYGRDITDPGKELPKEYLSAIYDSIREEEIRTEGEGADGSMTVERWKDVLRGSVNDEEDEDRLPTIHDAEDLTELVLEHVWMPIMSAISALWGVKQIVVDSNGMPTESGPNGMLAAQGARLGMDMAYDMMVGVRNLGRTDVFLKIFDRVCIYTGLLTYTANASDRARNFSNSVEAQGAFILALRIARETNEDIGVEGFKKIWSMIFELRDLKMLGGGVSKKNTSIVMESDPDLLKERARKEWNSKLVNKGRTHEPQEKQNSGLWSALFGTSDEAEEDANAANKQTNGRNSIHGKESHILWDDVASNNDEGERSEDSFGSNLEPSSASIEPSIGAHFERHLLQEDMLLSQQREMLVTGLERVEDTQALGISPSDRVRKRLEKCCDYVGLVSDSRFMDDGGLYTLLQALVELLPTSDNICKSDDEAKTPDVTPISPASAAFAEVLICEIALRNRDRLTMLWSNVLQAHYSSRLSAIAHTYADNEDAHWQILSGAIEKSITGLLRISCCAVQKGQVPNEVLSTWSILESIDKGEGKLSLIDWFELHLGEGLWRITRCVDGATKLEESGWNGLFALSYWCADRGLRLPPVRSIVIGRSVGLAEDDPSLQAYRSLHFLLNASEVKDFVPAKGIATIRCLTAAGNNRNCPKLSIAGLDLLHMFSSQGDEATEANDFWKLVWKPVVEGMTEAIGLSAYTSVRQHALSMLTDLFLEKQAGFIPISHLCDSLGQLCIPLAGRGIVELREGSIKIESTDELMIELDLCIGLIFKPLRHHLKDVVSEGEEVLLLVWKPILDVLKDILNDPTSKGAKEAGLPAEALHSTNELTIEHLRNVVHVLTDFDILKAQSQSSDDITQLTWDAIESMPPCKEFVKEWKQGTV
ncbi:unnamed protein product [Cylindrotheca closterium]|uniref:SEC7 domain-containing protein n=1 Tax=Cylindrotheca closterium TaxID=2856 RepID=A0AAD2G349_9STRA|nr:unnamed protein product [Cylindrotheca closterium]